MKSCLIDEEILPSRTETDRLLRQYRRMYSVMHSSSSYGRRFGGELGLDEASMQAQMYAVRNAILSIRDIKEKVFLYNYYVRGLTLVSCAKVIGVSLRTVSRIKNSALDSVAEKINELSSTKYCE